MASLVTCCPCPVPHRAFGFVRGLRLSAWPLSATPMWGQDIAFFAHTVRPLAAPCCRHLSLAPLSVPSSPSPEEPPGNAPSHASLASAVLCADPLGELSDPPPFSCPCRRVSLGVRPFPTSFRASFVFLSENQSDSAVSDSSPPPPGCSSACLHPLRSLACPSHPPLVIQ